MKKKILLKMIYIFVGLLVIQCWYSISISIHASETRIEWQEYLDKFLLKVKWVSWNMTPLNYKNFVDSLIEKILFFKEKYRTNTDIVMMIDYLLVELKYIQQQNNSDWCIWGGSCESNEQGNTFTYSGEILWEMNCWEKPKGTQVIEWIWYKTPWVVYDTRSIVQGQIKAYRFIADKSFFPTWTSILFETSVNEWGSNRADITLSKCPWVFESSQIRCSFSYVKINNINTTFSSEDMNSCILEDWQQYYLNIRPSIKNISNNPNVSKIFTTQKR